jgi:large subunit ribosomal protein L9
MQIILLKDVENLGLRGDVVDVARGYARNFLLPRQLAEVATPARVTELQRVEAQRAKQEARSAEQAEEIAEVLGKTVLTFEVKSGPTGSLFGSVTPTDVVDEIWRTRKIRVDRRKVAIDPIKRIGRYTIPIDVFEGVRVDVKTLVVPEGGELPPEEELEALAAAEAEAEAQAAAEHEEAEAAIAEVIAEDEIEEEAEEPAPAPAEGEPVEAALAQPVEAALAQPVEAGAEPVEPATDRGDDTE